MKVLSKSKLPDWRMEIPCPECESVFEIDIGTIWIRKRGFATYCPECGQRVSLTSHLPDGIKTAALRSKSERRKPDVITPSPLRNKWSTVVTCPVSYCGAKYKVALGEVRLRPGRLTRNLIYICPACGFYIPIKDPKSKVLIALKETEESAN